MSFLALHALRLRAYLDAQAAPQPWVVDRAAVRRLGVLGALATVGALLLFAAGGYHAGFDALNLLGPQWPPWLLHNVTYLGDSLCVLVGLLVVCAHRREVLWTGYLAAVLGTVLSHLPKRLFEAARPPAVLEELFIAGPAFQAHSFPSGHTVSIFVGAGMVLYFARSFGVRALALAGAALVGASRVVVGVHWPLDVLAGAAIGLAAVALAAPLAVRSQRWAGPRPQVVQALLLAGCALALCFHRLDYPFAQPLGVLLGLAGLAAFTWHYGLAPSLRVARA